MCAHRSAQGATANPVRDLKNLNCHPPHPVEINDVERLQQKILDTEKAQRMAEFFSLLGDPNRLRIISLLAIQELCVCDLAAVLDMSESAVSHQMRALRTMRLVRYHKQGRKVFYRANPQGLEPMLEWMTRYAVFWSQRLDVLERLLRQDDAHKPKDGGKK